MTSQETNTLPNLEIVFDASQLDEFKKGSYYTITGAGGDLNEWVKGYTELLQKEAIGTPLKFYSFTGKQMNSHYGLSGSVAYDPNLAFLSFPLDELDIGKLAMFKIKMQDRWFDDIVDNNERHMREQ